VVGWRIKKWSDKEVESIIFIHNITLIYIYFHTIIFHFKEM